MPFAGVTAISLEQALPAIEARTNGFAAGDTLRGHFRLQGVGPAELYIQANHPPYIVVQRAEAPLYLGFEDPARTQEVFSQLEAAWKGARGG